MINAYDYIKSESIKKYLKDINYKFKPLEIAAFAHKFGNYSIEEELKILETLIKEYPDSKYDDKYFAGFSYECKTWHNALKSYIKYKKASFDIYFKSNEKNLYRFTIFIKDSSSYIGFDVSDYGLDMIFSSYEKCFQHVKNVVIPSEHSEYTIEDWDYFEIEKLLIDNHMEGKASFNKEAKITDIYIRNIGVDNPEDTYGSAFLILPNLPVPFKDGDILSFRDKPNIPVYIHKCNDRKKSKENNIFDFKIYTLDEMGNIVPTSLDPCFGGELDTWTYLEYYNGDKDDKDRLIRQVTEMINQQNEEDV